MGGTRDHPRRRQVITWFTVGEVSLLTFALIELFMAREPLLNLRRFQPRIFLVATLSLGYLERD